jgi:hypothetical protein
MTEPGERRLSREAPRVAVVALVAPALVQPWLAGETGLDLRLRAAILVALAALQVALLVSLGSLAVRLRGWAIAGLAAWTLGWIAHVADLGAAIAWALGGPAPVGVHRLDQVPAALVEIVATAGGVALGAAIARSFRDVRTRHSAVVLLVGYAIFGLLVAGAEHRIALVTDFPGLVALRRSRDLADSIRSFALAGVLWQAWRQRRA